MRGNAKIFCLYRMQKPNFVRSPASKREIVEMTIVKCVKTTSSRQRAANDTHLLQVLQVQGLVLEHHQPQQGARHLQHKLLAEIIRTRPEQLVLPVPLQ